MRPLDWIIVCIPLLLVLAISLYTRRYVKGVSDYLAAGRVAGRYVVAVAAGEASMGLITVVAQFEFMYASGFAVNFWGALATPIMLLITLTGFAIYRYRESRAMTMGQFFEIRYSKKFRIFSSGLAAISGIVNYGLFPAVGARFLVYFCGLPQKIDFLGFSWPTFAVLMALFLTIAVVITCLGGQLTIMTSDCVMGILSYPMYLAVAVSIFVGVYPALARESTRIKRNKQALTPSVRPEASGFGVRV
jgi:SSS family solute:Na+ symporter